MLNRLHYGSDNPLYQRLTKQTASDSGLASLIFTAVVIGIPLMLIGGASSFFIQRIISGVITVSPTLLGGIFVLTPLNLISFAIPLYIAARAAAEVAKDARSDDFELLKLTEITEPQVVSGYIAAMLYRNRLWVAVLVVSLPVAFFGSGLGRMLGFIGPGDPLILLRDFVLVAFSLISNLFAYAILVFMLLALATWFGLSTRDESQAALFTIGAMLAVGLGLMLLRTLLQAAFNTILFSLDTQLLIVLIQTFNASLVIVLSAVRLAVGVAAYQLARNQV